MAGRVCLPPRENRLICDVSVLFFFFIYGRITFYVKIKSVNAKYVLLPHYLSECKVEELCASVRSIINRLIHFEFGKCKLY